MVCPTQAPSEPQAPAPFSRLSAFLVERNYKALGCDRWNSREVRRLMAKLGDTQGVMAARMRITEREFERRLTADVWTKQDMLILTILDRAVDATRGIVAPGNFVEGAS